MQPFGEQISSTQLSDAAVLGRLIERDVVSVDAIESMSGAGGLSGEMTRLRVTLGDGAKMSMVVKTTKPNGEAQSGKLGLAREAYFFHEFAAKFREFVGDALPRIYYCCGDYERGHKLMIMEDLSEATQLGYFFGKGSPLNWGKDLAVLSASDPSMTAESATELVYRTFARLHAMNWGKRDLLEKHSYLRGSDWFQGRGEESFLAAQAQASNIWTSYKAKMDSGKDVGCNWSPSVIAALDASFSRVSWADFQQRVQTSAFTLVHGDSHPANMMWSPSERRLVILDFEVVGFGSGPQDLSQFLISHMAPDTRRQCEDRLVRAYYDELIARGVTDYTWEQCWNDYITGCERWVWLLALLCGMCPGKMVQYWHDQLMHFMNDHGITADKIGQPRV